MDDAAAMAAALCVAEEGLEAGELPIGAVVVVDDEVIARAHTQERAQRRLLVHAELLALDAADRELGADRLRATLYTTLEPCLMCLAAAASAAVPRIVFALASPSDGAAGVARMWDEGRSADLPHVRLPELLGGVGAAEAHALFVRYCAARPDATDGPTRWARSLL